MNNFLLIFAIGMLLLIIAYYINSRNAPLTHTKLRLQGIHHLEIELRRMVGSSRRLASGATGRVITK